MGFSIFSSKGGSETVRFDFGADGGDGDPERALGVPGDLTSGSAARVRMAGRVGFMWAGRGRRWIAEASMGGRGIDLEQAGQRIASFHRVPTPLPQRTPWFDPLHQPRALN